MFERFEYKLSWCCLCVFSLNVLVRLVCGVLCDVVSDVCAVVVFCVWLFCLMCLCVFVCGLLRRCMVCVRCMCVVCAIVCALSV